MELPEEVRKKLDELIATTDFRSSVCEATVIAHVGAYVEREILEVYISHLKNDAIKPNQKARNVGDLIHRILENEGDMLAHLLRRAFDECIAATQGSEMLKIVSSATTVQTIQSQPKLSANLYTTMRVIALHPLAFASIASTAALVALWLFGVITWDQLQTLLQPLHQ